MSNSTDGRFLLRPLDQNIDELLERRIGSLDHLFRFHSADRMLDNEQRMIRCAKGFALGFRQRVKGMGDHRDSKPAALL